MQKEKTNKLKIKEIDPDTIPKKVAAREVYNTLNPMKIYTIASFVAVLFSAGLSSIHQLAGYGIAIIFVGAGAVYLRFQILNKQDYLNHYYKLGMKKKNFEFEEED